MPIAARISNSAVSSWMSNCCVWIDWLKAGELPEASIVEGVLKIIPPDDQEREELEQLTRQAYAMLPRIKITDLLIEVDEWTNFTGHFTHLHNGEGAASFPPSKLLHIGMKSCGWPHPSNRAPSPPRSCCASWVPTHVRTHSLWPYEKSGNWNAHYFCWSSSRTSNCESAFMLV